MKDIKITETTTTTFPLRVHLPLFNAAEDEVSLCCCFASTNTDVGKLLTSTVVDNKIEKMAKT